jgi:hypothetical protein
VISVVLFLFILSPIPTLLDCLVIAICVIDNMGIMYFWGIEVNAVSVTNCKHFLLSIILSVVVSIGVTVEFSSYIAKTYSEVT